MYHTFYTSAEKSFNHQAELFVAWDMSAYTRHILFVEKCSAWGTCTESETSGKIGASASGARMGCGGGYPTQFT